MHIMFYTLNDSDGDSASKAMTHAEWEVIRMRHLLVASEIESLKAYRQCFGKSHETMNLALKFFVGNFDTCFFQFLGISRTLVAQNIIFSGQNDSRREPIQVFQVFG